MAEVLSETEGEPATRPIITHGLTLAVDGRAVWQRLEAWTAHRWGARSVTWVIEGPGTWTPRLRPAAVTASEIWRGSAWEAATLRAAPTGYDLDAATYRVTATVGDPEFPAPIVCEAWTRLAFYLSAVVDDASPGHSGGRDGDFSFERPAEWAARAMHYSGAGDLLRAYR